MVGEFHGGEGSPVHLQAEDVGPRVVARHVEAALGKADPTAAEGTAMEGPIYGTSAIVAYADGEEYLVFDDHAMACREAEDRIKETLDEAEGLQTVFGAEWKAKVASRLPAGASTTTVDSATGVVTIEITWALPNAGTHRYRTASAIRS
jgi:hypothetical protein